MQGDGEYQGSVDAVRSAIAKRPQRQDSLAEQMRDLHVIAAHLGMYDAADFIWKQALDA